MTVTQLPLTRCEACEQSVAHKWGKAAEALTEHYVRFHPDALQPERDSDPAPK